MLLPHQIERIISLGGGVQIRAGTRAGSYLPFQIEKFAALAGTSGAALVVLVESNSLLPHQMEKIAALGKGQVIFKFE